MHIVHVREEFLSIQCKLIFTFKCPKKSSSEWAHEANKFVTATSADVGTFRMKLRSLFDLI